MNVRTISKTVHTTIFGDIKGGTIFKQVKYDCGQGDDTRFNSTFYMKMRHNNDTHYNAISLIQGSQSCVRDDAVVRVFNKAELLITVED